MKRLAGVAPALAALAACTAGGAICFRLHTPLPWMTGALVTMAVLKFAGLTVAAPRGGRETGQILIATALGLYFTPTVAREVLGRWELLVAAAVFATVLAYVGAWMISHWSDTDRTTALFASVPGGATEMMHLGERFGARPDRIAVAQSLRILIVVIAVPAVITWWGVRGAEDYVGVTVPFDTAGLAILLACTVAGGLALWFVGSPNPFMLGALIVAIGLTLAEVQWSSVPTPLVNAAQVLLGCNLGSRFERAFVRGSPRFVLVVVASIVAGIAISALFAGGLAWWSGLPVATMVLATAPGGIAEMCITAKVLQLGVPLVTAAHVTRVIILVTTTGPLFRLLRRLRTRPRSD
ncbi:MAG: AbrB family transcriptional regulator [Burkholderiales bacterium]